MPVSAPRDGKDDGGRVMNAAYTIVEAPYCTIQYCTNALLTSDDAHGELSPTARRWEAT